MSKIAITNTNGKPVNSLPRTFCLGDWSGRKAKSTVYIVVSIPDRRLTLTELETLSLMVGIHDGRDYVLVSPSHFLSEIQADLKSEDYVMHITLTHGNIGVMNSLMEREYDVLQGIRKALAAAQDIPSPSDSNSGLY